MTPFDIPLCQLNGSPIQYSRYCCRLDSIATAIIEDLIDELKKDYSIAIVTHSIQQTSKVSQRTAFFHLENLIEIGPTDQIFLNPLHQLANDYIAKRVTKISDNSFKEPVD